MFINHFERYFFKEIKIEINRNMPAAKWIKKCSRNRQKYAFGEIRINSPFGSVNSVQDYLLYQRGQGDLNRNTIEINRNTPSAKYLKRYSSRYYQDTPSVRMTSDRISIKSSVGAMISQPRHSGQAGVLTPGTKFSALPQRWRMGFVWIRYHHASKTKRKP